MGAFNDAAFLRARAEHMAARVTLLTVTSQCVIAAGWPVRHGSVLRKNDTAWTSGRGPVVLVLKKGWAKGVLLCSSGGLDCGHGG